MKHVVKHSFTLNDILFGDIVLFSHEQKLNMIYIKIINMKNNKNKGAIMAAKMAANAWHRSAVPPAWRSMCCVSSATGSRTLRIAMSKKVSGVCPRQPLSSVPKSILQRACLCATQKLSPTHSLTLCSLSVYLSLCLSIYLCVLRSSFCVIL